MEKIMKPSARRARYLLRKSRKSYGWKVEKKYENTRGRRRDIRSSLVFVPVGLHGASKLIDDPDYENRGDWGSPRTIERTILSYRMWDVDHDLSDCCGRGYNEHGELVYPWRVKDE
jgi:hypothetical protein